MTRTRLDTLIVQLGLVENREKAKARVMAGEVTVNGALVTKSGYLVRDDSDIKVMGSPPFVSRGGLKLDHALNDFQMDVSSKVAMDVGASTGGFTDCLIKRGASKVYAVDVVYQYPLLFRRRQEEVPPVRLVYSRDPALRYFRRLVFP